jgi:hypothetical protein
VHHCLAGFTIPIPARCRALAVGLALAAIACAPLSAACPPRDGLAATLLFPYFEVDLDGARTTLLAINTSQGARSLVRVTLWTDWGIPTLSFDLYLGIADVQTINLRDLFATGAAPVTRPPAGRYVGCPAALGGAVADPAALRAKHTGAFGSSCWSSSRSDRTLATGYVTVDVVRRCDPRSQHPASAGYFRPLDALGPVADFHNNLWGDFLLVDPAQNFASAQAAVPIVADTAAFGSGDYTFYGRYVGFSGADKRRPLARNWNARFLTGGAFDGGTQLLVWRDNKVSRVTPYNCGTGPAWVPMGEAHTAASGENGEHHPFGITTFFHKLTQRVDVRTFLDPPYDFGWLALDLGHANGSSAQGWVGWIASAEERFSVGLAGTPMNDDPCLMRP